MIKRFRIRSLSALWLVAMLTVMLASTTQAQTIETVIPADSLVYLKLQNLKECREAIENSENWKEAAGIISTSPKWQPMNQFMQMLPMFTGTDIQGLIETFFGGQVAVTVSAGAEGLMVGIAIENEGKLQEAEETLSKLIRTLGGMMGGEIPLDAGNYQGIPYHTAELNTLQLTYGRVDETFLLVGITPGSFEKMVDTYKKVGNAITENTAYQSVVNNFGGSEMFAFVDMEAAKPFVGTILPPPVSRHLEAFKTLVYSWDLLRPSGSLQLYGTLKEDSQGTLIPLLQEQSEMASIQGLSGEEAIFLAVAPSSSHTIWQMMIRPDRNPAPSRSESMGSFLIPDQADVLGAVTGEFVISADLSTLEALEQHGTKFSTRATDKGIESVEIDFPEADLGIIFKPDSPAKWQTLFSGLLDKIATELPRQFDYKGITFNTAAIPGTLHYGNVNDLFVLAFSEKKCQSIVDNLLTGKPVPTLKKKLEGLSANPAFLLQLNAGGILSIIANAAAEDVGWLSPEMIALAEKTAILFISLAVGADAAWLELTLSSKEKPIDAIARVAPLIFSADMQGGNNTE